MVPSGKRQQLAPNRCFFLKKEGVRLLIVFLLLLKLLSGFVILSLLSVGTANK